MEIRRTPIEDRLLRWMLLCGTAAVAAALVLRQGRFAGGLAAGFALSVIGFLWLRSAVAAALDLGRTAASKGLAFKLVLRYPLILGAFYLFYRTRWLPIEAVLAGLFVPLAGGVVECLYQLGVVVLASRR